jgi:hypothetical protein
MDWILTLVLALPEASQRLTLQLQFVMAGKWLWVQAHRVCACEAQAHPSCVHQYCLELPLSPPPQAGAGNCEGGAPSADRGGGCAGTLLGADGACSAEQGTLTYCYLVVRL